MRLKTKYAPRQKVLIGRTHYEILSVKTNTTQFGGGCAEPCTGIFYHVQDFHGRGCTVLEQMITRRVK